MDSNKTSNKRVKTYYLKKFLVKVLNESCIIKKCTYLYSTINNNAARHHTINKLKHEKRSEKPLHEHSRQLIHRTASKRVLRSSF